jgi:hypothetical protein
VKALRATGRVIRSILVFFLRLALHLGPPEEKPPETAAGDSPHDAESRG